MNKRRLRVFLRPYRVTHSPFVSLVYTRLHLSILVFHSHFWKAQICKSLKGPQMKLFQPEKLQKK